MYCFFKVESRK